MWLLHASLLLWALEKPYLECIALKVWDVQCLPKEWKKFRNEETWLCYCLSYCQPTLELWWKLRCKAKFQLSISDSEAWRNWRVTWHFYPFPSDLRGSQGPPGSGNLFLYLSQSHVKHLDHKIVDEYFLDEQKFLWDRLFSCLPLKIVNSCAFRCHHHQ